MATLHTGCALPREVSMVEQLDDHSLEPWQLSRGLAMKFGAGVIIGSIIGAVIVIWIVVQIVQAVV